MLKIILILDLLKINLLLALKRLADLVVKNMDGTESQGWIDDELINLYSTMILKRSQECDHLDKIHIFSTHFFTKLQEKGGHKNVSKWARKVNLKMCRKIFVPIHCTAFKPDNPKKSKIFATKKVHWALAEIGRS